MSAKAIREATGKELINKYLEGGDGLGVAKSRFASVTETTEWNQLLAEHSWLATTVSSKHFVRLREQSKEALGVFFFFCEMLRGPLGSFTFSVRDQCCETSFPSPLTSREYIRINIWWWARWNRFAFHSLAGGFWGSVVIITLRWWVVTRYSTTSTFFARGCDKVSLFLQSSRLSKF